MYQTQQLLLRYFIVQGNMFRPLLGHLQALLKYRSLN